MRVIFPTPEFVTEPANFDGGLATYLSHVTRALADLGHEPLVFVSADRSECIQWNGISVHRVCTANRMVRIADRVTRGYFWPVLRWGWQGRMLSRALAPHCREVDQVLVQYPNYTAPARHHAGKAPALIRLSSYQPLWREAHGHGSADGVARQIERLEHESLAKAAALFAPSRLVAELVSRKIERPVEVIASPFVPMSDQTEEGIPQDWLEWIHGPYFLFFGSLSPMKGIEDIARVLAPLLQTQPEWHFVFAGRDLGREGDPIWPRLKEAAGAESCRVHYLGRLKRPALAKVVAKAGLVVLPSVVDNMPNTVLEAMAAARVVVGTRGSSIDEMITDGEDGVLCEAKNPSSLLNAIKRAVSMPPQMIDAIGQNAKKRVGRLHPQVTVARLVEFYQQVLLSKNAH